MPRSRRSLESTFRVPGPRVRRPRERVAMTTHTAPASDFTELARQVREAGLMRRRYGYYWTKLSLVPVLFAATIVAFVRIGDSWWQLFMAAWFAFLFTQTAFLGHDAAHRQIFRSGRWNDWTSLVLGRVRRHELRLVAAQAHPAPRESEPARRRPRHRAAGRSRSRPSRPAGDRSPFLRLGHGAPGGVLLPDPAARGALAARVERAPRRSCASTLAHRAAEIAVLAVRLVGYLALVFLVLSPGIAVVFLAVQLGLFGFYMGVLVRPEPQGHAARTEGPEARLPAPPGAHEPRHPRQPRSSTS